MAQRYEIGNFSYPEGIGSNDDLQHSITFYINVRSKSKFYKKEQKDQSITNPGAAAGNSLRNKDLLSPSSFGKLETAVVISSAAAAVVRAGAALTEKSIPNVLNAAKSAAKTGLGAAAVGSFVVGSVAAAVNMYDTLKSDNLARLKDRITLHMENAPSVSYGVNYQDKDMGILGGFLNPSSSASNSTNGIGGELGAATLLQVAKIPSILPGFGSASLSDIAQFGAKVKTNPFREVFFEGVDYRKFNFKYTFYPKNANESASVRRIIDLFKEHMHPELSAGGYFYVYPSEFEIKYYYKDSENGYFNKIAPCALTSMSVDYGGSQFSSFSDGAPTQISMSLSFRELESIRKQGY